jgi:hypothetical protein
MMVDIDANILISKQGSCKGEIDFQAHQLLIGTVIRQYSFNVKVSLLIK